jgi:hypothetical protein
MSVPSSTDFFPKDVSTGLVSQQFGLEEDKGHVIQRVDSGETKESPFRSNLATPVNKQDVHYSTHGQLMGVLLAWRSISGSSFFIRI